MAKKQNYSYKTRRLDTLTNRLMIVFGLLVLSVWALLSGRNWLLANSWISSGGTEQLGAYPFIITVLLVISLLCLAASVVYFTLCRKKNKDEGLTVFSSSFIMAIAAAFFGIVLMLTIAGYYGYIPSIVFAVLVSLLYFIAVAFPGSYVAVTVFNALGAFLIYALHLVSPIDAPVLNYVLRTIILLLTVPIVLVLIKIKANSGELKGMKILNPETAYSPFFIAIAIFALFIILGMFGVASYIIFDVIIALETIIFALFYAIKMLK